MKHIIVTGASGLVATELIHQLVTTSDEYTIYAVSERPESISKRYQTFCNVKCLSLNELPLFFDVNFDACVHCAFSRNGSGKDVASSLNYTKMLLQVASAMNVSLFVNISSQSVYDSSMPPLRREDSLVGPDSMYAVGKYASELLAETAFKGSNTKYLSIRLSSVSKNARFLNVFVKNALTGMPITVQGGNQVCSFVDVRDVASGLKAVIDKAPSMDSLAPVYNLGSGTSRTIKELAYDTKRLVEEIMNIPVEVNLIPADIKLEAGMDISLFCSTFSWRPSYDYDDMIKSLISLNGCEQTRGLVL